MVKWITLPGLVEYCQALAIMEKNVDELINQTASSTIYLLEHQDIYTAGTNYRPEELLNPGNIPVIYTGRGGKFTYHGPGQRVIYPILHLPLFFKKNDLKLYVSMLEQWIINTLNYFGVKAYTVKDRIGIWVKEKDNDAKIASIGIRVKKWVAYHGIAVNLNTNLNKFSGIIACGLEKFSVTSLERLGIFISFSKFDQVLKAEFYRVFNDA